MQGVIFDVDGTMVDNMMIHHRLWHKKLNELGLNFTLAETMEKAHGVNVEFLRRFFGSRFTDEELLRISNEKEKAYRAEMRKKMPLVPGVESLIKQLHQAGIKLAVGSAGPPENVNFVLQESDLRQYFGPIYHSGNVSQGKPHPEVYLNGARDMDVPIAECLVIEDTPIGAKTALNAGAPVLIVTTTHDAEEFEGISNVVDFVSDFSQVSPSSLKTYFSVWAQSTRSTIHN